ncbi:MAG: acyl--CoA ligase [Rhodospirillaceae bacterium]|nr:acyl--CoA ligase [Rhodospirillaceae bacterium]
MSVPLYPTIAAVIERACHWKGGGEILCDRRERLSGIELWRDANAIAAGLGSAGLQKGDVAAFLCASSARFAVTFIACQIIGVVPCCLHTRQSRDNNAKTADFVGARLLIADAAHIEDATAIAEATGIRLMALDGGAETSYERLKSASDGRFVPGQAEPGDAALLLLSSGTTGKPKCVQHTQATLAATALMGPYNYRCFSPDDVTVVAMEPSFAAWIHTALPFIAMRGRVVFDDRFDPGAFLEIVQREKITLAPLVPTAWRMVLAAGPEDYSLGSLKSAFFSGEPGSASLVRELNERICRGVVTSYLSSEGGCASGIVADTGVLLNAGDAASTGRPVPGANLRLIDPDGGLEDQVPTGAVGEIAITSASVAQGYFRDPSRSREKFADGWWRSGDLGRIDENGALFIKGRLDNRINSGGIKVHAEEIEAALLGHPKVRQAGVVGVDDATWGQRIEAHLVTETPPPSADDISDYCRNHSSLPKALLPKAIHFHDSLPTGPTGKLYRRALITDDAGRD